MKVDISEPREESEGAVLVGGLATIFFGLMAVLAAIGAGWVVAAMLGLTLLVIARTVPVRPAARLLPPLLALLGVVSLLGAAVDLLT